MAAFTAGNIVVYRVGAGATALSSAATQVFLDEYTPAGALVQSIPLPTATSGMQDALTASGTATSEGLISDSTDGRELLLTGYDATAGTASVNGTSASADPRVLGVVGANGVVDTSTVLTGFSNANNIRTAASVDGSAIYAGGATGAAYTTPGSTAAPSMLDAINTRQIEIFGGQIYYSTGSGTAGIYSLGTGLPTSGTQTATLLPGTNSNGTSPYAFYLADLSTSVAGYDTLYVADSAKGIEKFALVGGTWTSVGQIAFTGVTGLTATVSGSTVTLYATSPGAIDKLVDTGGYDVAITGALSTIAAAATNEAFRGVAFAPTNPPPVLTSVSPAEGATGVAAGANVVLTFNESVQAGSGAITVTDSAGDTRTIPVTDGSQVSFNGATVTINPTADLKASDTYHVTFGPGVITDPMGVAYGGAPANTIDFTTAAAADTTPPTLASASPAEGATNVAAGANVVLTFSEAVKAGTGGITITDGAGDSRTIDVTDTSQATFNGAVLTLNPTADLKGTDTYHVTFGAGVVTDLAGNSYAGVGSGVVDFTTADTTAPVLASTTPAENATDVAIGANLVLTFSKAVQAGVGSIVLHPTTGTGADVTIPVGDAAQVSFSGATLTLNPTADLRPGVTYAVEIAAGVVQDANGNAYGGGTGTAAPNDALDFTTSSTIPAGASATPFTISDAGTFTLLAGTTRTQTAGVAVKAVVATGATTIDLEGTLNDTAAKTVAVAGTLSGGGQITVGANGVAQSLNADTIQALAPNATVSLTNQGQIISATSTTTVTAGGPSPGTGYALNFNAVVGAAGAAAGDFTSGGTITNGSTSNTSALIRSDSGDAVRLGSHETLVNYGTITADGPVNDSSTNNSFNNTSTATPYDISRGVRINQSGATSDDIENHGAISGSQHGVDVGQANVTGVLVNNYAGATIIGHNGSGVGADTTGAAANTVTVNNYGVIRGEYAPTYDRAGLKTTDGDGDGVDIDGAGTVYNAAGALIAGSGANGVLTGQGAGGYDSNGRANKSEGLSLGGGSVDNFGTISGADYGVSVNNDGATDNTRSGVAAVSITNEVGGAITGQAGYAIRIETKEGSAATDNDTIVNHGTITGNGVIPDPAGVVTREGGAPDPGVNGTLDGVTYTSSADAGSARFISGDGSAIQTGEGADVLSNYGAIVGATGRAINLEGGDDTLNLYTGSSVTGRIDGGAGNDTLNLLTAVGATTGTLANVIDFESLHVQSGAWTIADSQAYASGTTIDAGATLQLGSGGTAGALTGPIADAGVLSFDRSDVVMETQAISGGGVISQIGAGTTTFSVAESFTGAVQIAAGVLDVAVAGAVGSGQISFTTASATLKVEAAALQSGAFANVIGGSVAGDVIDLAGIGAATSATVSGSTLTVSGGSQTATLHLDPTASYFGLAFTPTSDGAGGTKLTVQSAAPPATVLQPGDIAIIGYGASAYNATTNPDGKGVAAVLLTSITGGTVIHFTDDGWVAASGTFRTGEGDLVYTAPAGGAAAGTVITFLNQTGNFNFSTSGDQVTIFQGSLSAPTNDFALNFNSAGYTDATNSNTTAVPTGLTLGATAITFNGMLNGAYTGPTSGTKAELLAAIDKASNWTFGSSTTPTFQTTAFSVAGTAPDTTPPTLASSSPADHATGVAPTSNVGLMFSEVVKAGGGSIVLHPDSGADVMIAAGDTSQVTISGANVTINPTADLAASTHYEVLIGSTAFTDTSNNAFAGTTGNALDFTTGAAAAPSLSIAGVSMAEGNSGQTPFAFTVTRTGDTSGVSTVHYATADGTATVADGDYATASGDLSFAAGQTTATITVQVNGDTKVEPNETFTLALSSPSAGTNVSTATATGTIVNDDVTITPIYTIQGAGHVSPYVGQAVSTRGIVTLVDTNNHGFWLQDATGDGDVNTSDAIHVYYGSSVTVPTSIVVGADVTVSGQVNEVAQGTGGDFTLTEIDMPSALVNSVSNALPAAVLIGPVNDPSMNERAAPLVNIGDNPTTGTFDPSTQGSDFWESLEGMRVTLLDTHAVGPYGAGGNLEVVPNLPNDPANNMFGGVTASNTTPNAPIAQSLFDFNPERVEVYTGRAANGTIISRPSAVNEGDHLGDITGVVSYYDEPEVLATSPYAITTPSTLAKETTTIQSSLDRITIGAFNVENLSPVGTPFGGSGNTTQAKFDGLAQAIVHNLNAPTILALEEIQDNSGTTDDGTVAADQTLVQLMAAIVKAGGPQYTAIDAPPVNNQDAGAPGGNIRVAYLYNAALVQPTANNPTLTAEGSSGQVYAFPTAARLGAGDTGTSDPFYNTRKSVPIEWSPTGYTTAQGGAFTTLDNHLTAKGGSDPLYSTDLGPDGTTLYANNQDHNATRREGEGIDLNTFAKNILNDASTTNDRVVELGDFNEYQFFPSVLLAEGALTRITTGSGNTASTFAVGTPILTDLISTLPTAEQYTYSFDGNNEALDQVLVNNALVPTTQYDVVHINAEFANQVSDHDPSVTSLLLPRSAGIATAGDDILDQDTYTAHFGAGSALASLAGSDVIDGGAGNDLIIGGGGADFLIGGAGSDTFRYLAVSDSSLAASDLIEDFQSGADKVDVAAADGGSVALVYSAGHTDVYFGLDGAGNYAGHILVYGEAVQTADVVQSGTSISLFGSSGADVLAGGAGSDFILGGAGDDFLIGGGGADRLVGGPGSDVFIYRTAGDSPVGGFDVIEDFQSGQDIIDVHSADSGSVAIVYHAGESDVYYGLDAAHQNYTGLIQVLGDAVRAGDILRSSPDISLFGSDGADILAGGTGDDFITGGAGNDLIEGHAGNDRLVGGPGDDAFIIDQTNFGQDQIYDFLQNGDHDVINFTTSVFADTNAVLAHSQQVGTDVLITYDASDTILLHNVQLSQLNSNVFEFH